MVKFLSFLPDFYLILEHVGWKSLPKLKDVQKC